MNGGGILEIPVMVLFMSASDSTALTAPQIGPSASCCFVRHAGNIDASRHDSPGSGNIYLTINNAVFALMHRW